VFEKVASVNSLRPGNMMKVEITGKEICISNIDGKYYAIGNRCTHMGCLLSDGELKGENVTCPCHGSVFNLKTGAVLKGPAKTSESVFEVKVESEQVLVNV
jgi:nitrite reductase/ring-hydroxylating ferredoxin subunit